MKARSPRSRCTPAPNQFVDMISFSCSSGPVWLV
jgi:hypothetical protein